MNWCGDVMVSPIEKGHAVNISHVLSIKLYKSRQKKSENRSFTSRIVRSYDEKRNRFLTISGFRVTDIINPFLSRLFSGRNSQCRMSQHLFSEVPGRQSVKLLLPFHLVLLCFLIPVNKTVLGETTWNARNRSRQDGSSPNTTIQRERTRHQRRSQCWLERGPLLWRTLDQSLSL